jgi:hypothetical protein
VTGALSEPRRAAILHYAWLLIPTGGALYIASHLLPTDLLAARSTVSLLGTACIIAAIVFDRKHSGRLCEVCIAKWPLNPEPLVQRRMRWLRLWHQLANGGRVVRWTMLGVLLALTGASFLSDNTWYRVSLLIVTYTLISGLDLLFRVHARLDAWCPWCRGDGGDDDVELVPPPVPTARGTR